MGSGKCFHTGDININDKALILYMTSLMCGSQKINVCDTWVGSTMRKFVLKCSLYQPTYGYDRKPFKTIIYVHKTMSEREETCSTFEDETF